MLFSYLYIGCRLDEKEAKELLEKYDIEESEKIPNTNFLIIFCDDGNGGNRGECNRSCYMLVADSDRHTMNIEYLFNDGEKIIKSFNDFCDNNKLSQKQIIITSVSFSG